MVATREQPAAARRTEGDTAASDGVDVDSAAGFAAWWARWWEPTRRLAGRQLGDWTDAEDVASEVLLRVWRRWQVAGVPEQPDRYVRRAVANQVASRFRRRDRERVVLARAVVPERPDTGPEEAVTRRGEVEWLLRQLSAPDRDTVARFYLDDCSAAEIAAATGLAPVSVRSRLHRSRRYLAGAAAARAASGPSASNLRTRATCGA